MSDIKQKIKQEIDKRRLRLAREVSSNFYDFLEPVIFDLVDQVSQFENLFHRLYEFLNDEDFLKYVGMEAEKIPVNLYDELSKKFDDFERIVINGNDFDGTQDIKNLIDIVLRAAPVECFQLEKIQGLNKQQQIYKKVRAYIEGEDFQENQSEINLDVVLYSTLANLKEVLNAVVQYAQWKDSKLARLRDQVNKNCWIRVKRGRDDEFILPIDNHEQDPITLIKIYLTGTPLEPFFFASLPFSIPWKKRFEHCHICAGSGHGKTQLLLALIYNDLLKAKKGKGGFCVIDSQGDLIDTLSHLADFDPEVKNTLAEKLVLVDPTDIDHPTALNMFDVDMERINRISDPAIREMAINATISLYEYIFADLIGGTLTLYQKNIYNFGAKLLLNIEGANILTFVELLQDGQKFKGHLSKLDQVTQQFFNTEFFSKKYDSTKEQIATRLWNILSNQTFQRMFAARENKIDMFDAMNNGKIVLINTAKALLQEDRCKMLGKFFVAMILQATYQRATIPEDKRKSFFVYIDEAQDYLSDTIAEFLSQARKYRVGLILAHQYLTQLDNISRNLKASVMANTAIKLMGKVELADAKAMADRMRVKTDNFLNLKKKDRQYTEYLCYLRDITDSAVKIAVPLGVVNRKPQMSADSLDRLRQLIRGKFCIDDTAPGAISDNPAAPDPAAPEPGQEQTAKKRKLKPRPKLLDESEKS